MKKKLLLVLSMVVLFALVLAFSVSADNALKSQDNDAYGEISFFDESVTVGRTDAKNGFTPYIDAEGTAYARVVVGDGTTFYTFPTAYILSNSEIYGSTGKNIFVPNFASLNSAMESATGKNPNWTADSVYRIELPVTVTRFNGGTQNFGGWDNVIEIRLQPDSGIQDQNKTMMFWKCFDLEVIHNLDTFVFRKGCLGGAFQGCAKLTSLTIGYSPEVTATDNNVFEGCTSLVSVNFVEAFPNITNIGNYAFKNCNSLTTTNPTDQAYSFKLQSGITSIGTFAFEACNAVKYISLPATLTYVGQGGFYCCTSLEFVEFNNNQNDVNFNNCQMFMGCTNLKAMSMPDKTDYITNRFFSKCTAIQAVYLPSALVTLETNGYGDNTAFFNCYNAYFVNEPFKVTDENGDFYGDSFEMPTRPEVYYFPPKLANLFQRDSGIGFAFCYNLNPVMVMPETITKLWINDGVFYCCGEKGATFTVVFLGDMTDLRIGMRESRAKGVSYVFANEKDVDLTSVKIVDTSTGYTPNLNGEEFIAFCKSGTYFKLYNLGGTNDASQYTSENTPLIEGDKHIYCIAANTQPTCTTDGVNGFKCFCGVASTAADIIPAYGHLKSEIISIIYNGEKLYFENGDITYNCERCAQNHTVEDDADFIFKAMGYTYTTKENPKKSIMQSFAVNRDALNKFNAYTENDILDYGVLAATESGLGETRDVFDADGKTATSKVNTASYMNKSFDIVEMKLGGLEGEKDGNKFSSANVYCCAYILVKNGEAIESYYASVSVTGTNNVIGQELTEGVSYDKLTA